jgi:predicted ATPase/DNA-binding winged helix-turn-helix (wHTH) protein
MSASAAQALRFGPYVLRPDQRLLTLGDTVVPIGSRALDILLVLIDADGELLNKEQLLARVWGDVNVDESTLRVHIAGLRKAIGDGRDGARYILNEQGRGYRFVAPISGQAAPAPGPASVSTRPAERRAAPSSRRMVGREAIVQTLAGLMPERGFMTITGPGGIGKTTVAQAVADALVETENYSQVFVDLAPVVDSTLVANVVAVRLGVTPSGGDLLADILARLSQSPILLLLDNCEHVVDAVAEIAEAVHAAGDTHILATSREPLRAEGEWVHRLQPLPIPGGETLTAESAVGYAAVQLFTDRARAANDAFALTDANATSVAEICRRLDGMPLALELAAARVDMMRVEDLAAHLDDRFSLLTGGRRSALPRQQTLRATLDWSYDLLPRPAQTVLNRLGVFAGPFSLDAARGVASCELIDRQAVLDIVNGLTSKSLVSVDMSGSATLYRLLDTTRAYAREKLSAARETERTARRHADHCGAQFTDLESAWEGRARCEWLAEKSRQVDEVRAALAWAFSDEGDLSLAVKLIVSSAPLWFHLTLPGEFLALAERAMAVIPDTPLAGSIAEMELRAAQGHALWHTQGPVQAMRDAFDRAMEIAQGWQDPALLMRAHWGLWAQTILAGDYAECAVFAHRFKAVGDAAASVTAPSTADRMLALHHHFIGEQTTARTLIESVLRTSTTLSNTTQANHAQVNGAVAAQALLMRILWVQGFADQALALAKTTATAALATDHDLTICYGLAIGAAPVALWTGQDDLARQWITALLDRARGQAMGYWEIWGQDFLSVLDPAAPRPAFRFPMQAEVLATTHAGLADLKLFERLDHQPALWCAAELLRLKALTAEGAERETLLQAALASARTQGALSWELRAAISLAESWRRSGDEVRGHDLVTEVLARFSEGADTPDQRKAQAFLHAPQVA